MMAGGGGAGGAGVGVVAGRVSTGVTARRCAGSGPAGSALAEGSGAGVAADAGSASEAAGAAGSGSPRVGAGAGNPAAAVSVDTVMDSADARGDSDGAGTDVAPAAAAGAASFEGVAWRLGPTPMPRKARGATVGSRLFTSMPRPSGVLSWTLPSIFSPGVGSATAPTDLDDQAAEARSATPTPSEIRCSSGVIGPESTIPQRGPGRPRVANGYRRQDSVDLPSTRPNTSSAGYLRISALKMRGPNTLASDAAWDRARRGAVG